jgi:hypothetical protein
MRAMLVAKTGHLALVTLYYGTTKRKLESRYGNTYINQHAALLGARLNERCYCF